MTRSELWSLLRWMAAGALVGFACGAGCGEMASTWNDLFLQGVGGAAAGAAVLGVLRLVDHFLS